jgi:hypothetical protein
LKSMQICFEPTALGTGWGVVDGLKSTPTKLGRANGSAGALDKKAICKKCILQILDDYDHEED